MLQFRSDVIPGRITPVEEPLVPGIGCSDPWNSGIQAHSYKGLRIIKEILTLQK
jgi:hypothetical protein